MLWYWATPDMRFHSATVNKMKEKLEKVDFTCTKYCKQ